MTRPDPEQLLGGYATGTLSESEKRSLFEGALVRQDLFDALADEDLLRELLADPRARAELLAALAPARPRVVPLWRRPGAIGAAAGLLVAVTAGLVVLRSPVAPRPALPEVRQALPAPVPPPSGASARAGTRIPRPGVSSGPPALFSPAPAAAGAFAPAVRPPVEPRRPETLRAAPGAAKPTAEPGAPAAPRMAAPPSSDLRPAETALLRLPAWSLEAGADGTTRVVVTAPSGAYVVLLRRGGGRVEVLAPAGRQDRPDLPSQWRFQVRLASGDDLDLYVFATPVADPAGLPATGPVAGFRARIRSGGRGTPAAPERRP